MSDVGGGWQGDNIIDWLLFCQMVVLFFCCVFGRGRKEGRFDCQALLIMVGVYQLLVGSLCCKAFNSWE